MLVSSPVSLTLPITPTTALDLQQLQRDGRAQSRSTFFAFSASTTMDAGQRLDVHF